jgi:hypothetical protein
MNDEYPPPLPDCWQDTIAWPLLITVSVYGLLFGILFQ